MIQILCDGKAVDQVSEEKLDACRDDASLVEEQYGWMDFSTIKVGEHICRMSCMSWSRRKWKYVRFSLTNGFITTRIIF